MTTSTYLNSIKSGAIEGWHTHQIAPSITGAQAALESGWGTSSLAKPPYNNNFGIKASADWSGRTVSMPTREWLNGQYVTINASFRAYDSIADSVRDHAAFFTNTEWRRENYKHVVGEKDYKKAARALQSAGYATDPSYATKLINIIEQYQLYNWDTEAYSGVNTSTGSTTPSINPQPRSKVVGGELSNAGRTYVKSASISVIGDSLGVGTKPYLESLIPNSNYDVVGNRQITHTQANLNATTILRNMLNAGTLKNTVVVIIGTNRGVTQKEVEDFADIAGTSRKILFVDTASQVNHASEVSRVYKNVASARSNVFYVNWRDYALSSREAWYYADGAGGTYIHMNSTGYRRHAEYIAQAIYEADNSSFSQPGDVAVDTKTYYAHIGNLELGPDGIIEYEATSIDGQKKTFKKDLGVKGFYSPKGDMAIYNPEANEKWNNKQDDEFNANWIEAYFEESDIGLDVTLLERAVRYLDEHREPSAQYRIQLADIPQTLSIGDTGVFIDHDYNPPLYIEARVLELTTSRTNPSQNTVLIGNVVELQPQAKGWVHTMQQGLQQMREDFYGDWINREPISIEIEPITTLMLSESETSTYLSVKVKRGSYDVTEYYSDFRWERISSDVESDEGYNAIVAETENSSVLYVTTDDLYDKESTFVCRIYDDAGSLVGSVGAIVREAVQGKSAFEIWKEYMNLPNATEEEYVEYMRGEDGEQGIPGQNSYLHTAWATDPLGTDFSTSPFDGATWLGTCTTESPEDPEDYSVYDWVYVKGDPGLTEEEHDELMESIEDTQIIKDLVGLDGEQTFNKNRLDGPVNRVITKGSSTEIRHNGDGYVAGDRITISADISCLMIEPTTSEVQFDFNVVNYQPPIKPRGEVQFLFNVPGYIPTEPIESNFDNARVVNFSDYGGIGDGATDNFDALQRVVDATVNEPLKLLVDDGNYFLEGGLNRRLEPWPYKSKGLRIEGTGNYVNFYHKNNRDTNRHEHYFMQMIMEEDSLGFEVDNIMLNGIRNPQEELFYTQSPTNPITNVPMARGFSVDGAHHVIFNNVRFKNMYGGYAIQLQEYRNVSITNTTYDKVGGNDTQESFGMAIYLGGHSGNAVVEIDNAQAQGMVTDKGLKLSWIGVVLENGTIQSKEPSHWLRDKNTVVRIKNSSFLDYHSTFHTESVAGNVYWNVDNVTARGSNYNIVAGVYGEFKEVSNRITMDVLPYGRLWGIVKGLYYSEPQEQEDNWNGHNRLEMHNSIINFIKVPGFEDPPQAVVYGNNVTGYLYNTQLNNVPNRLVTNGSAILYDCEVNLAQGNNATRASLMAGEFSDTSKQRVEFFNTGINPYGSHKDVTFGDTPEEAWNKNDFEAPWIDLPITAPI